MTHKVQVQATREGGGVQRFHASRHTRPYDVAQHTFGALNLLLILHPSPSLNLIKALQWHDIAERWTGDVPGTAYWMDAKLKTALEDLEIEVLTALDLLVGVTPEEFVWLKTVDILELWLWCRENSDDIHVAQALENCAKYINSLRSTNRFPDPAWAFFVEVGLSPVKPLPDLLDGLREAR